MYIIHYNQECCGNCSDCIFLTICHQSLFPHIQCPLVTVRGKQMCQHALKSNTPVNLDAGRITALPISRCKTVCVLSAGCVYSYPLRCVICSIQFVLFILFLCDLCSIHPYYPKHYECRWIIEKLYRDNIWLSMIKTYR